MLKTGYDDFEQYENILGIDECGYGCGAGDIYAVGVILPKDYSNSELKDSKRITSLKKRERIYDELTNDPEIKYVIKKVSVDDINSLGVSKSMSNLFQSIVKHFENEIDAVFIDGIDSRGLDQFNVDCITVTKGDNTYQNIAAASIICKVARDRDMVELAKEYPGYDLENNKGYLTPKHIKGIKENGVKNIHRKIYVKNFI